MGYISMCFTLDQLGMRECWAKWKKIKVLIWNVASGMMMATSAWANDCNDFNGSVPQSIIFVGEAQNGVSQFVDGAFVVRNKNRGASYIMPCTTRDRTVLTKGTQWVFFKLRTSRYFGNSATGRGGAGVGDHIPVLLRASFQYETDPYGERQMIRYRFRGPIFHKQLGVLGEYSSILDKADMQFPGLALAEQAACEDVSSIGATGLIHGGSTACYLSSYPDGPINNMNLRDDVNYWVLVYATTVGIQYWVAEGSIDGPLVYRYFNEGSANGLVPPYQLLVPSHDLSGDGGFGVAVLCNSPAGYIEASCEASDFSVSLTEIVMGWF